MALSVDGKIGTVQGCYMVHCFTLHTTTAAASSMTKLKGVLIYRQL